MRLFATLLAASLAGCAAKPRLADHWPSTQPLELEAVPFFPQREYQCGPAALATVLLASGVPVTADELAPQVFLPDREGSLQLELLAAARRYERVPYLLPRDIRGLFDALAAGHPVLLLQNLGVDRFPVWHYAVLVGIDPAAGEVILRSGETERRVMRFDHFFDSWRRGGQWALILSSPDQPPAGADATRWIAAAAAFEELARPDLAARAYRAATRRWPRTGLAWTALGNALYAQRDLAGAAKALRSAAAIEPSAAVHNNLAQVLLERGCPHQARKQIELAFAFGEPSATMRRTEEAVKNYAGRAAADCGS